MAAVLGAQLAFTMIVASILSKFSGHYSFGRWILCSRLVRFVHPSDEELRKSAGFSAGGGGNRGKQRGAGKKNDKKSSEVSGAPAKDEITLAKSSIDVQLECTQIRPPDLLVLKFYTEFQWLLDFTVCAAFIYATTELYYCIVRPPSTETNLSLLWCFIVATFALKIMASVTAIYFRVEEGGERVLCVVFGFFFLVVAMAVLVIDERTLDFGLEAAYTNFSASAIAFLNAANMSSTDDDGKGPVSLRTIQIVLAIMCAITGAFLTFPGLRLARMHSDALRYMSEQPMRQLLLYINILFPLIISLTWIRPLFRDHLVGSKAFPNIDDEAVGFMRVCLIIVFVFFRFCLVWTHLQAHLNMAVEKLADLKKEAGRISASELKKLVVRVYYYLCVVALQYLAPLVLLFFCALLLKSLGDYSVSRIFGFEFPSILGTTSIKTADLSPVSSETLLRPIVTVDASEDGVSDGAPAALAGDSPEAIAVNIIGMASQFSHTLHRFRLIFTPVCFRGLLSFASWWICTAWFMTSAFGLIYHSYFKD